jgi:hypothetical protein
MAHMWGHVQYWCFCRKHWNRILGCGFNLRKHIDFFIITDNGSWKCFDNILYLLWLSSSVFSTGRVQWILACWRGLQGIRPPVGWGNQQVLWGNSRTGTFGSVDMNLSNNLIYIVFIHSSLEAVVMVPSKNLSSR